MVSRLLAVWRNLRHRDRVERELDDELRATLDLLIDEKVAAGIEPREAKRRALIELRIEPVKERVRDIRSGILMDTLLQDVKFAVRHMRRSPGFATAAILTLALGIGANTAMFSVLNTLTLERLAIADPDGLYSLSSYNDRGQKRYVPMPTVLDLNREGPFVEACGYNGGGIVPMEANGIPTQGIVAFITGRCFSVFGVRPVLGRGIVDEDAPIMTAGAKVVVISDRLWSRLFNRSTEVLGKTMRIDSAEAVVIGVAPPGFRGIHADSGIDVFAPPDSLIPATQGRRPVAQEVLGRLKPGITFQQAQAQFDTLWPVLLEQAKILNSGAAEGQSILGAIARLDPMGRGLSNSRELYAQPITIILGLTALLLLLACVNLGGLLLTRLSARSTELGVRLALGGSRPRIVQQMLVESLLLSGAGSLLAVPTAFVFVAPIPAMIDPGFVGWELSFTPNLRVLAVTAVLGFVVGVLLTALPTWFAIRRHATVQFTWDRTMTGAAGRWTRGLLVIQVALSLMMVVGAALLARSLQAVQNTDPGVRTENMLTIGLMAAPGARGLNAEAHYPPLIEKLRAIPGVRDVSYSAVFPRRIAIIGSDVGFVGEDFKGVRTSLDSVSPNFFDMMGIRLIAGRTFSAADHKQSQRVVILTEGLARQLAPDGNILDRHLKFQTQRNMQDLTVIGVVANATQGNLKNVDGNVMFSPAMQSPTFNSPNIMFEISGDPVPIAEAVRRIVLEHGREFVFDVDMLDELLLSRGPARERMSALLSAMIGGLAILLAVIGIHGVLTYSIARRTREIGVRIAVGADPGGVARSVIRESTMLTLTGLAIGVPAALGASRALRSLLFGISETDTISFAVSTAIFLLIGMVAGVLPARRAARIDPVIALRAE